MKKQRTEQLQAEWEAANDDDMPRSDSQEAGRADVSESEAEEESGAAAAAGVTSPAASSHNTPSAAFFAPASTPMTAGRLTTNPCNPLPAYLTRIRHAKQLVIVSSDPSHNSRPYKVGSSMDVVELIEDGGMVVGHDGRIVAVGSDAEIAAKYDTPPAAAAGDGGSASPSAFAFQYELDARDLCILPGLVDGHTHPVWAGDRVHEFKLKLDGATYMEIHQAGGGIGYTVTHTRAASEESLLTSLLERLDRALRLGTTTLEAKSGYGLELDTELKMLRVIQKAHDLHPIDLVGNYCGAHSVPKGSTAAEATADILGKQLPAIMRAKGEMGLSTLEMIDVFCEKGVFEREDTAKILKAGQEAGLAINFHGDELSPIQAAELGAELNATAISHLEHVSWARAQQAAHAAARQRFSLCSHRFLCAPAFPRFRSATLV